MNEIIQDLIDTGLATIVGGSVINNPANIAGNALESSTDTPMLKTVAKILQSVNMAYLTIWASVNAFCIVGAYNLAFGPAPIILAGLALGTPLLFDLGKRMNPSRKEQLESFDQSYTAACKATNALSAAIIIGFGAYIGAPSKELISSGVSLISSAYTLQKPTPSSLA